MCKLQADFIQTGKISISNERLLTISQTFPLTSIPKDLTECLRAQATTAPISLWEGQVAACSAGLTRKEVTVADGETWEFWK